MEYLDIIALALLIIFIGLAVYAFLIITSPPQEVRYKPFIYNFTIPVLSKGMQFYPKMRFPDREITYFIELSCSEEKSRNVIDSFSILSKNTILHFSSSENNPRINILCSQSAPEPEQKEYFVAGEGGPTEIINTSNYFVILKSKVFLYKSDSCNEPKIALHELLHALGFDHINNVKSIMYPVTQCDQKLDDSIAQEINEIYKTEAAPDLALEAVTAHRVGRYLSFQANISNIGLVDVDSANLSVYTEGNFVKSYPLNEISIGKKKIISVTNFRVDDDPKKLEFVVDSINPSNEISRENNMAVISLSE